MRKSRNISLKDLWSKASGGLGTEQAIWISGESVTGTGNSKCKRYEVEMFGAFKNIGSGF